MKSLKSTTISLLFATAIVAGCGASNSVLPQIPITKAIDKSLPSISLDFQHSAADIATTAASQASKILNNMGTDLAVIRRGDRIQATAILNKNDNGVGFHNRGLYVQINEKWYKVTLWGEDTPPSILKEDHRHEIIRSTSQNLIQIQGKPPPSITDIRPGARVIFANGIVLQAGPSSNKEIALEKSNTPAQKPKKKRTIICRSKIKDNCARQPLIHGLGF